MKMMEVRDFLRAAASVVPSARQKNWFETEFYAFVHFTVNTYTNLEWGLGDEPESIFNPVDLDCDQWVEAVKSTGMKGLILTAKHHDGFCLWPSRYTEHSVKNSPWKNGHGDVVRECAEACRRGGIKFGVYLSPWDRNSKYYGTPEYNDYYCNQLTELLTEYGELFMIWFDGACGEGPNGKKQEYDFPRYIELIRKYQPNAVIFNDFGPDVRWCGNEAGQRRHAEWAVVPTDLCYRCEKQVNGPMLPGDLSYMYNPDDNIGELNTIVYAKGLAFCGAEIDMSIRPGWFYHENEEPHSLDRLMKTYINACGGNTSFNLNIPPMPSGRFDERDVARLQEFGKALENAFGEQKKLYGEVTCQPLGDSDTQCIYHVELPAKTKLSYITLREDLDHGQRIEHFTILANGGAIYHGTTVGHKQICPVNVETKSFDVRIEGARDTVYMRDIVAYKA